MNTSKCFVLTCRRRASFEVGIDEKHPLCRDHAKQYKQSSRDCHLTDFAGRGARGRAKFNLEVYNHCTRYLLHEPWGAEYFLHVLHQHSHKFAGAVETQRRTEHVRKFFAEFDEKHMKRCFKISKNFPRAVTGDHLLDIALACFVEEANLTGNGRNVTMG